MSYKIKDCGGCGNCMNFVQDSRCPVGAFLLIAKDGGGYTSASIDPKLCIDCGLCKSEIDCLCEAINEQ